MTEKSPRAAFRASIRLGYAALALLALWLALPVLLSRGAELWLQSRGIDQSHIEIRSLDTRGIILGPSWVGAPDLLSFDRADIVFAPSTLIPQEIEAIGVIGLRARAYLAEPENPASLTVRGLEPLLQDGTNGSGGGFPAKGLPSLSLAGAQIRLAIPDHDLTLDLNATGGADPDGYHLDISRSMWTTAWGTCQGPVQLTLGDADKLILSTHLVSPHGDCLTLSAQSDPLSATLSTEISPNNPLWAAAGLGEISGKARLDATIRVNDTGALAGRVMLMIDKQGLIWPGLGRLSDADVTLTAIQDGKIWRGSAEAASAHFQPDAAVMASLATLPPEIVKSFAKNGIQLDEFSAAGAVDPAGMTQGDVALAFSSGDLSAQMTWQANELDPGTLTVRTMIPALTAGETTIKKLAIQAQLPLPITALRVEPPATAKLNVSASLARLPGGWSVAQPVKAVIDLMRDPSGPSFLGSVWSASVTLDPLTVRQKGVGDYRVTPGIVTLTGAYPGGRWQHIGIDVQKTAIHQQPQGLVIDGLSLRLRQKDDPSPTPTLEGDWTIDRFARLEALALHLPVAGSGKITAGTDALTLTANFTDVSGRVHLAANLGFNPATSTGKVTFKLDPLQFGEDKLSLSYLSPFLAQWADELNGEAAAQGSVDLAGKKADIHLLLKDLSLTAAGTRIERINTVLTLTQLWPLSSKGRQELAVGAIAAGVPMSDGLFAVTFDNGKARLEEGHLRLGDGQVRLSPATFDLLSGTGQTMLTVENVDLGALLAALQIKGLTGTGQLGGSLPVTLTEGLLQVGPGALASQGPGTLSYASEDAAAGLGSAASQLDILLGALANFHYDKLQLDLMRDPKGQSSLSLHIGGNNPDFYGGYPVELNIAVTGALEDILSNSLAGYRVPDEIRKRLENFLTPQQPPSP